MAEKSAGTRHWCGGRHHLFALHVAEFIGGVTEIGGADDVFM